MKKLDLKLIWKILPLGCSLIFLSSVSSGQDFDLTTRSKLMNQPVQNAVTINVDTNADIQIILDQTPNDQPGSEKMILPESVSQIVSRDYLQQELNQSNLLSQTPDTESPEEVESNLEELPQKSLDKAASYFLTVNNDDRVIPNDGYIMYYLSAPGDVPADAVITDIQYRIRIVPEIGESTFFPYDYEIFLKPTDAAGWETLYQNLGSMSSHYDEGFDDDAENDADIYLNWRSVGTFNGDPAGQTMVVYIGDNTTPGGYGLAEYVQVRVYWESPDPNLTSYTPGGWDDHIVISDGTGTHTNASNLYAGLTYYIDFTIGNYVKDITSSFTNELWIDGGYINHWNYSGVGAYLYLSVYDQPRTFTAGEHEICTWADSYNVIVESNEDDNINCVTYTWNGPPPAPTLVSPANGATCQSTSVLLDWNDLDAIYSFQLQVDNNSDFSSPVNDLDGILSDQMTPSGLSSNTTYHWRVRGINPAGNGTWSSVRSFTTAPASAPSAPALDGPSDGATCQPTSITLDWNSTSGASTYNLQVDNNGDFSSPVANLTGLTASQTDISGLAGGSHYYWRVAAVNSCGSASGWSSERDFTTGGTPDTPTLSSPSNEVSCQPTSLTLSWSSVSGASSYNVVVDDNNDFSSLEVDLPSESGTSTAISGLAPNTKYYWIVRARNSCGSYSGWSTTYDFTTAPSAPGTPTTSLPAFEATCQALALTLDWSSGSGASTYMVQLDDNSDFSSPLVDEDGISATSNEVSGLAELTTYYWRTKSVNSCSSESDWSGSSNFTTLLSTIGVPSLTGPTNAATCQATSPTLTWGSVTNASAYDFEVDDNNDFSSPEITETCTGASHNCSALTENSTYYWRVKSSGDCSVSSDWSAVWSFGTGTSGMAAPTLDGPADNSSDQSLTLTLAWTAVTDATSYQFQLDDNNDFSSPLYDEEKSETSIEVAGLTEGTTYFWQVRANGSCSTGDWSSAWQFETESTTLPEAISSNTQFGYALKQNYPNPFMETTTIEFKLPVASQVILEFMDLQGKLVESLTGYYHAGNHSLNLDLNGKVQSGVYLYRMRTQGFIDTKLCIVR